MKKIALSITILACLAMGIWGAFAVAQNTTLPSAITPTDVAFTVNWDESTLNDDGTPLTDLSHYELAITDTSVDLRVAGDPINTVVIQTTACTGGQCSATITGLFQNLPDGTYRLWARAINNAGNAGVWGAPYDLPAFDSMPPNTGSIVRVVAESTYEWDPVTTNDDGTQLTDLAGYEIGVTQGSTDPRTGGATIRTRTFPPDLTGTVCRHVSPELMAGLAPGDYRLWLRCVDIAGNVGDWGGFRDVTYAPPTTPGPPGNIEIQRITMTMTDGTVVVIYERPSN